MFSLSKMLVSHALIKCQIKINALYVVKYVVVSCLVDQKIEREQK